ncbi:MAG: hypothetical protein MJA82_13160 [Clostridia bacterium]|nr:hypothetical protein [Clostridia bacterium]
MYKTNEFERNDLINFIRVRRSIELTKMNDSFKFSAVLVFMVTLINRLINNYINIISISNNIFILFFAIFANVLRVIFRILNITSRISTSKGIAEGKLTELDRQSLFTMYIMEIIYDGIAFTANFLVVGSIYYSYSITKWLFVVFMISDFIGFCVKLILFYMKFISKNNNTPKEYQKSKIDELIENDKISLSELDIIQLLNFCKKVTKVIMSLNYITILFVVSLQLLEIIKQDIIIKEPTIFVDAISIIALLVSFQVISRNIAYKKRYSWLEYLEKKIFLENLDTKTIMNILETEYLNTAPFELIYYNEEKNIFELLEEKFQNFY